MGSINVLENFTNYYGLPSDGTASTGIVFAVFQVGQMCAALFVWVADWLGRKWLIFIGAAGVAIGTVVTATAPTLSVFIGGRFLLSFFAQLACSASPLYLVEVAPPQYRGTLAGMYNTFYYLVSSPRALPRSAGGVGEAERREKRPPSLTKERKKKARSCG